MKNIIGLFVFSLLAVSCSKPISTEELKNLNGYWEINEVKTSDGDTKEFQSNNNVDLFELDGLKGTRTKVVPQLDGKKASNGIKEQFTVLDSANATYLKYTTDFSKWTEKVDKLTKDELVIINQNDIKYTYKRVTPIVVNE
ncbi:hypothetical protein NU10_04210 [Flavobacterium dauae]|uniref:hypothetical protein n=1 Tax=Flavobacterium dauae TaxID=1563479 RepID=UPI00101B2EE1|nr:hypothetical protein [Flavobacterium dauae]WLD24609.1 hypothetical protein NU10_04210 [Flavobacterium dauae]